jgi:hypothetical protein
MWQLLSQHVQHNLCTCIRQRPAWLAAKASKRRKEAQLKI